MISIRSLLWTRAKPLLVREYARRQHRQTIVPKDPGISRRFKNASYENTEHPDEANEDFDDFESDFMAVGQTHREYEQEVVKQHEKLKFHIVKQKDFKQKLPNFLTWHDKEQIRYLHTSDPAEWTVERLSEGFPALPNVINKIINTKWTVDNQKRVSRHDEVVQNNWNMLKTGKFKDLPPELLKHLNKFSNRALIFRPFILPKRELRVLFNSENVNTFSSIIAVDKSKKDSDKNFVERLNPVGNTDLIEESGKKIRKSRKSNSVMTLDELKSTLGNDKIEKDEEDKLIAMSAEKLDEIPVQISDDLSKLTQNKYKSAASEVYVPPKTNRDYSHLVYPEKIEIPKHMLKKGRTYKLYDCYYDESGEFLYRVPGMV